MNLTIQGLAPGSYREITKEEYDRWRYRYPELDTSGQWHKIMPSQELSDLLLADLKEHTGK